MTSLIETAGDGRHDPTDFLGYRGAALGTTSIISLARHPQVFMSRVKETNYFLRDSTGRMPPWIDDETARRTPRIWNNYEDLFAQVGPQHRAVGESSPSYLYAPCAVRIERMLPDAKLIVILRRPVEQARSILATWLGRPPTLTELVTQLESGAPGPRGELPLAQHGRYAEHLTPYYDLFPREHILVVKFGALERGQMTCSAGSQSSSISSPCGCLTCISTRPVRRGPRFIQQLYSAKRIARALLPKRILRRLTLAVHRMETANTACPIGRAN